MTISLILVILIFLFITLNKNITQLFLIKTLIIWLFFYRMILGSLNILGVPDFLFEDFIMLKEAILISIFVKSFKLNYLVERKINRYITFLMFLAICFLLINEVDIFIKLDIFRNYYLYIFLAFMAGYSINLKEDELDNILKFYVYLITVMAVWSITVTYIIGTTNFYSLFPYPQNYVAFKDSGIEALNQIEFKLFHTSSSHEFRLRDFNGFILHFGNFIAFGICFAFYLVKKKIISNKILFFLIFTLLISLSRAATFAGIIVLIYYNRDKLGRYAIVLGSLIIILFVFVGQNILLEAYVTKFNKVFGGEWKYAVEERAEGHSYGWYTFGKTLIENPLGYGYGHTGKSRVRYKLNTEGGTSMITQGVFLTNLGILGLFVYLAIHWRLFKLGQNLINKDKLWIIFTGVPIVYNIIGLTKEAMLTFVMSFLVFLILGISYRLSYNIRDITTAKH